MSLLSHPQKLVTPDISATPRYRRSVLMGAWAKFRRHKAIATHRGIPFLLQFDQWWEIWQQSGHWHERGRKRDQYVMARLGPDIGPYAVENVKIIPASENVAENRSTGRPIDQSSIESKKPWLAAGITRRTWFRRRAAAKLAAGLSAADVAAAARARQAKKAARAREAAQRRFVMGRVYSATYYAKNREAILKRASEKHHAKAAQRRRAASEIGRAR